jgi:hypothetical protein
MPCLAAPIRASPRRLLRSFLLPYFPCILLLLYQMWFRIYFQREAYERAGSNIRRIWLCAAGRTRPYPKS